MNASNIIDLLATKHSDDVFVPECKDGPTQLTEHNRMDAWVMAKSWAHPTVTAYEVKVSRGDFLADRKWRNYLPLCNEFYFVCPYGLIGAAEIDAEAGLLWTSKNGNRLYTKKRAPYREVQIPESVFRYVLMCRTKVTRESFAQNKRRFWEQWLEDQQLDWQFGHNVGKRLQERISSEITRVADENATLKRRMESYDEIRALLKELGLEPNCGSWRARERIEEARAALPPSLRKALHTVATSAAEARDALDALEKV